MATAQKTLASGSGWQVSDVVCTAVAGDRPFEEEHRGFCIAAVTNGAFRYRTRQGTAMLAPGAILLGNPSACYECGHEHGAGDRCISFHFSPAYMERVMVDLPGVKRLGFADPRLPPLPSLTPVLAEAEAARETGDDEAFEELGLRIAGAVVAAAAGPSRTAPTPSRRDQKRVAEAVRLIELNAERPLSLTELADCDIVFTMVDLGLLMSLPTDSRLDFVDIYDFDQAFEQAYPWSAAHLS